MAELLSSQPPPLGPGISIKREFLRELVDRASQESSLAELKSRIGWLEVVPENFIGRGGFSRHALLQLSEKFPIAFHGITLSIGSVDPLREDYLKQLGALARDVRARWITDHLCYSSVEGVEFHNLLPLPFTREAVKHVVKRIKKVQSYLGVPFGLENPSYYAQMPGAEMTEAQFLTEVLEQSDCFFLLDINNVLVNSVNHSKWNGKSFDEAIELGRKFLRNIPLDRVIEVHVAGHHKTRVAGKPILLDTHGAPVPDPVKTLLKDLHELKPIRSLLLERESHIPPLQEVLDEASTLWTLLGNTLETPAQEEEYESRVPAKADARASLQLA